MVLSTVSVSADQPAPVPQSRDSVSNPRVILRQHLADDAHAITLDDSYVRFVGKVCRIRVVAT